MFSSITGVLGPDRIITYEVYAPKFDNNSQHVLDETTGSWALANNTANVTGIYNGINVFSNSTYSVTLKPLAIQKGVADVSTPPSPKPTDILRYTTNFQVSDYFSMGNVIITDVMGDGQRFLTDPSYIPSVVLHLPSGGPFTLEFDVTPNPNPQMSWTYNPTNGITTIVFNITRLLIDNGYSGILEGGNYTGTNYGATAGTLTYWSEIKLNLTEPINHPIVSNDMIDNTVTIDANLVNSGHGVSDGSRSEVVIVAPSICKQIYKINGNDPIGPPYIIRPGDTVTFSICVNVPTTNLENFILIDYLPIPFLRATEFVDLNPVPKDQYDTPPPAGRWKLAWDDTLSTLSGVTPTLIIDATQNTLTFFYGEIHNSTQPQSLAHILFTVTATGDPMADGLYLTNLLNVVHNNNFDESFSDNTIVSIVTGEPALTINKMATPTTNLQAGDEVTYTILISNTGNAPAYNVIVTDNLLTSNPSYIASISNIVASYVNGPTITGLNLMDLFTTGGLNFTALYPIFSVVDENNTINITYTVVLNDTVYPRQVIDNTVNITKYTSLPLPESPNYVRDPISSTASVQIRDVNFTKTYVSSVDGISSTPNLTIGERGLFRLAITLPAGQITDLVITDVLPAGLSYVSHTLDTTSYIGNLAPLTFNQFGNTLNFLFTGTTNTTTNSTFFIDLILIANENTPYPGSTNVTAQNTATMDWNNPGHSPINRDASVNIVQPRLVVTKTFTPSIVQGGQLVNVRIRVTNTGHATAQHVIITDSLNNAGDIFDLGSVVSYNQNGFTFTYPGNTVTFSWGDINPGQTLDFYFNVTTLDTPLIGPSYINTANATYWSLPWDGTSPDDNSREYSSTGSDTIRTGDPRLEKSVVNSSIHGTSQDLTIGEVVTFRLQAYLPQGLMTNLKITDTLPFGFAYVLNSYNVYSSGFSGTLGTLVVPPQVIGQNVIFLFSGLTNSTQSNNPFYIELNATVLNSIENQDGNSKQNDMSLTWDENTHGPFTTEVYLQIIEPRIAITKAATPTVVDGGDQVSITLTIRNTGSSNAYQINITDILNTTLFNPATWTYTPVAGYTFTRNANIISIIGDSTTFIAPSGSQTFTFMVNVATDVPSDSSFTNIASVVYSSMPPGFNQNRTYTATSNVVNFNTPPPSISKAIESTSEADSTGNNVLIGEVVTYRLNLTIPEGKTLNAVIRDILPSNLVYNPGTAQIMRNNAAITATGFTFTQPAGIYESFPDASLLPLLTFNLGDISFTGTNGLNNGIISIRFNVTVLNIAANQNGILIPNSGTLDFTNATGVSRSLTAVAPDLTVRVPQLQINKEPDINIAQGGDVITFFIRVTNSNYYAPAYNLQILDFLNSDYYNFHVLNIIPSTTSVIYHDFSTSNLLNVTIDRLTSDDWLHIYYRVTVRSDVTYNDQINNTVHVTGTSLPGDHGTNDATPGNPGDTDGKRTGDPTQPAGAVNNINDTSTAIITIRSPRISKNVNGHKTETRSIGETATEYIDINLPIGTTTELRIIDDLPEGLAATGFGYTATPGISVNQFVINALGGNIYEINFGNITVTQEGTLTLYYTVLVLDIPGNQNGVNLVNIATLYYLNSTGDSVNAGSDNATVQVVEPNLQIIKTPSKTNLAVEEEFTYTLFVTHTPSSTSDAHNLIITDTIPDGLTFVIGSQVCPGWTFTQNGNLLTFTRPVLTLSEISSTIFFNCIVNNDYTLAGQDITNYAILNYTSTTSGGREYTTTNSTQIHILGADLEVHKDGDSQVNAGEQVVYTIIVTNNGPDTAINAVLTDNILAPWFNRLINPQYSLNSGVTWINIVSNPFNISLGNILSGTTVNIIIRATVNASAPIGTINNTVHVTSSTTDPNPNNNNDTKLTDVDTLADLGVTKTGPVSVVAGNGITYTVVLTNYGPSDSQGVSLADVIPSWIHNVTYGAVSSSYSGHDVPLGTVWSSPLYWATVYANEVITLTITGTVNSSTPDGTVLTNRVDVTSSTTDPDPDNNNDTTVTDVDAVADLGVTKTGPVSVVAGNGITYTVVLTNYGPSDSQGVSLADVIPSWIHNVTYGAVSSSYSGHDVPLGTVWSSPLYWATVYANEVITLTITGTVNSSTPDGTVLTNRVDVTSSTTDPDPDNNNDTTVTDVDTLADLGVTKTGPVSVVAGNGITYTVVLTNYGPSDSQGVSLADVIPSWIHNVTYGAVSSSYSGHDVPLGTVWSSPLYWATVYANEVITLTITGTVNSSTPWGTVLTNRVDVTSSTTDPDPDNNNDTTVTDVDTLADLGVTKTGPVSVVAGNGITYTVVLTNYGPSDSQGVSLADVIPSWIHNVTYGAVSSSYSGHDVPLGTVWSSPLYWATVYANEVITLTITGTVNSSTPLGTVLTNRVDVTSSTTDPDPDNNNDTTVTDVDTLADLGVTKTGPVSVVAGNGITYTVVLTNYGPSDSQGVSLADVIPSWIHNVTYGAVSSSYSGHDVPLGTVWSSPLYWATVYANEVITLTITGTVNSSTPDGTVLTNRVDVTSSTTDPDPDNNNDTTVTDVDTLADLGVTKTGPVSVVAGNGITYTVVLTNYGPSDSQGVSLADVIPSWIHNVTYGAVSSSYPGHDVPLGTVWSSPLYWATVYANEVITLTITGTVNSSTPLGTVLTNRVDVTSSTTDPDPDNNNDTTVTDVDTRASLTITKTSVTGGSDVNKIVGGYPIHYTIVITNVGPSDALNVTFDDYYTPGILINTYYSTSTGIPWTAYTNPLVINPIIASLAPGQNVTIWINGTVMTNATEGINNTAGTSSPTDPDGRKTDSVFNDIQKAHVTIKKTVSNPQPYLHEIIHFTLIVQNWGPDTAIDVLVTDKLPAGIKYIRSTANHGSYNPVTGIWTIGNLPTNTIARLIITVGVEKLGPIKNEAFVSTGSWDPILGPRNASASIYVTEKPIPAPKPKTVGMQTTGSPLPLPLFVMAVLMVLSGFKLRRRR